MKQTLPDYIKQSDDLRKVLLAQQGFMHYVAEHIDDGIDPLSFYAQYQENVMSAYREANCWNPDTQLMSDKELWIDALGPKNHMKDELKCRKALERSLSGFTEEMAEAIRRYYDGYMAYAWRENFERVHPEHHTAVGFYSFFMEQFRFDGLIFRCMDIILKEHHGEKLSEKDQYDCYRILEYGHFYFKNGGIMDRLRKGVKEWLAGKDDEEASDLAVDMLEKVRYFSQHIYNDEAICSRNGVVFPLEDKQWLRNLGWDSPPNGDMQECFCRFVYYLSDVGRIWAARLLKVHHVDMHELERKTYSFLRDKTFGEEVGPHYYVDHFYFTDGSHNCCVNNSNKAKVLLCSLFGRLIEDSPEEVEDVVEKPRIETEPLLTSGQKLSNRSVPRTIPKPPTYMTLMYFRNGEGKDLLKKQTDRVILLYKKWQTGEIMDKDGGCWGWLPPEVGLDAFKKLFEGKNVYCELKFAANKTILSVFLDRLLRYPIPTSNGNKQTLLIIEQKKQSASKLVTEQFNATPNFNIKERLSPTDIARIKESIYILDYTRPIPNRPGGSDNDFDESDTTLYQLSRNIDLGISPNADVEQAIKSGVLKEGKHT